ncbi:MAG: helix-turn-helix transcriptional regulator [Oscillospiraceae bacterium]|nr:helix-turn-helix transcriptional regulator [Oscillospiraceae bacterium]
MTVNDRLRTAISGSRYTYKDLEDLTGIPKSSIQRYATGKTKKIPVSAIMRLAPHLGSTPAALLGWSAGEGHATAAADDSGMAANSSDEAKPAAVDGGGRLVDVEVIRGEIVEMLGRLDADVLVAVHAFFDTLAARQKGTPP